jgi:predicted dehydrogenase
MPITNGTESLKDQDLSSFIAIVAVGIEDLIQSCHDLIESGCKRILVEKPGALYLSALTGLNQAAISNNCEIKIGFNRRFYSSTIELQNRLNSGGKIKSVHFEFNEYGPDIANLKLSNTIKERWIIANSIHVIDLVFYLCGWPNEISCKTIQSTDWHPSGSVFAGSGQILDSTLFSYSANWNLPGRWKIEITTAEDRFLFQPIEQFKIWNRNENTFVSVDIEDSLDLSFKPGLYLQTKEFIDGKNDKFCDISELIFNWQTLCRIGDYELQ